MILAEQAPTLTPALSLREGEGALFETLAPAFFETLAPEGGEGRVRGSAV